MLYFSLPWKIFLKRIAASILDGDRNLLVEKQGEITKKNRVTHGALILKNIVK